MERYLAEYLYEAEVVEKAEEEDLYPLQYMGLSMEEAETLFGEPAPEDPVIEW